MTGIRSRRRPGDLALVPAKEREEVAVGVNRGELPGTEVRRSQFGARDVVKHPRGLQFANRASTSETSIRQLAVPARNDSAPEQIGRRSRSSRERHSSSVAPPRWSTASSRARTAKSPVSWTASKPKRSREYAAAGVTLRTGSAGRVRWRPAEARRTSRDMPQRGADRPRAFHYPARPRSTWR